MFSTLVGLAGTNTNFQIGIGY